MCYIKRLGSFILMLAVLLGTLSSDFFVMEVMASEQGGALTSSQLRALQISLAAGANATDMRDMGYNGQVDTDSMRVISLFLSNYYVPFCSVIDDADFNFNMQGIQKDSGSVAADYGNDSNQFKRHMFDALSTLGCSDDVSTTLVQDTVKASYQTAHPIFIREDDFKNVIDYYYKNSSFWAELPIMDDPNGNDKYPIGSVGSNSTVSSLGPIFNRNKNITKYSLGSDEIYKAYNASISPEDYEAYKQRLGVNGQYIQVSYSLFLAILRCAYLSSGKDQEYNRVVSVCFDSWQKENAKSGMPRSGESEITKAEEGSYAKAFYTIQSTGTAPNGASYSNEHKPDCPGGNDCPKTCSWGCNEYYAPMWANVEEFIANYCGAYSLGYKAIEDTVAYPEGYEEIMKEMALEKATASSSDSSSVEAKKDKIDVEPISDNDIKGLAEGYLAIKQKEVYGGAKNNDWDKGFVVSNKDLVSKIKDLSKGSQSNRLKIIRGLYEDCYKLYKHYTDMYNDATDEAMKENYRKASNLYKARCNLIKANAGTFETTIGGTYIQEQVIKNEKISYIQNNNITANVEDRDGSLPETGEKYKHALQVLNDLYDINKGETKFYKYINFHYYKKLGRGKYTYIDGKGKTAGTSLRTIEFYFYDDAESKWKPCFNNSEECLRAYTLFCDNLNYDKGIGASLFSIKSDQLNTVDDENLAKSFVYEHKLYVDWIGDLILDNGEFRYIMLPGCANPYTLTVIDNKDEDGHYKNLVPNLINMKGMSEIKNSNIVPNGDITKNTDGSDVANKDDLSYSLYQHKVYNGADSLYSLDKYRLYRGTTDVNFDGGIGYGFGDNFKRLEKNGLIYNIGASELGDDLTTAEAKKNAYYVKGTASGDFATFPNLSILASDAQHEDNYGNNEDISVSEYLDEIMNFSNAVAVMSAGATSNGEDGEIAEGTTISSSNSSSSSSTDTLSKSDSSKDKKDSKDSKDSSSKKELNSNGSKISSGKTSDENGDGKLTYKEATAKDSENGEKVSIDEMMDYTGGASASAPKKDEKKAEKEKKAAKDLKKKQKEEKQNTINPAGAELDDPMRNVERGGTGSIYEEDFDTINTAYEYDEDDDGSLPVTGENTFLGTNAKNYYIYSDYFDNREDNHLVFRTRPYIDKMLHFNEFKKLSVADADQGIENIGIEAYVCYAKNGDITENAFKYNDKVDFYTSADISANKQIAQDLYFTYCFAEFNHSSTKFNKDENKIDLKFNRDGLPSTTGFSQFTVIDEQDYAKRAISMIYAFLHPKEGISYVATWFKNKVGGIVLRWHTDMVGNSDSNYTTGMTRYLGMQGYTTMPSMYDIGWLAKLLEYYTNFMLVLILIMTIILVCYVLSGELNILRAFLGLVIFSTLVLMPPFAINATTNTVNKASDIIFSKKFEYWAHTQLETYGKNLAILETADEENINVASAERASDADIGVINSRNEDEIKKYVLELSHGVAGNGNANGTGYGGVKLKWMSPKKYQNGLMISSALDSTVAADTNALFAKSLLIKNVADQVDGQDFVLNDPNVLYLYRDYADIYRYTSRSYNLFNTYNFNRLITEHTDTNRPDILFGINTPDACSMANIWSYNNKTGINKDLSTTYLHFRNNDNKEYGLVYPDKSSDISVIDLVLIDLGDKSTGFLDISSAETVKKLLYPMSSINAIEHGFLYNNFDTSFDKNTCYFDRSKTLATSLLLNFSNTVGEVQGAYEKLLRYRNNQSKLDSALTDYTQLADDGNLHFGIPFGSFKNTVQNLTALKDETGFFHNDSEKTTLGLENFGLTMEHTIAGQKQYQRLSDYYYALYSESPFYFFSFNITDQIRNTSLSAPYNYTVYSSTSDGVGWSSKGAMRELLLKNDQSYFFNYSDKAGDGYGELRDFMNMHDLFYYIMPMFKPASDLTHEWDSQYGMFVYDDCSLKFNSDCSFTYNGEKYKSLAVTDDNAQEFSDEDEMSEANGYKTDFELVWNDLDPNERYEFWHDYNVNLIMQSYCSWYDTLMDCSYAKPETIKVNGDKFVVENPLDPTSYFELGDSADGSMSRSEIVAGRYMVFSRSEMKYYGLEWSDLTKVEQKILTVQDNVYKNSINLLNYTGRADVGDTVGDESAENTISVATGQGLSDDVLIQALAMNEIFEFNKEFSETAVFGESKELYPQGYEMKAFSYDAYLRLILSEASGEPIAIDSSIDGYNRNIYERIQDNTSLFFGIILVINDLLAINIVPLMRILFLVVIFIAGIILLVAAVLNMDFNLTRLLWGSFLLPLCSFSLISVGLAFITSLFMSNGPEGIVEGSKTINLGDPTMTLIAMLVLNSVTVFLYAKILLKLIKDTISNFRAVVASIGGNVATGVNNLGVRAAAATGIGWGRKVSGVAFDGAGRVVGAAGAGVALIGGAAALTGRVAQGGGTVTSMAGKGVSLAGKGVNAAGKGISAAGSAAMAIPVVGTVLGGATKIVGGAVQGVGKATDIAGKGVDIAGRGVQGAGKVVEGSGKVVQGAGKNLSATSQSSNSSARGTSDGVGASILQSISGAMPGVGRKLTTKDYDALASGKKDISAKTMAGQEVEQSTQANAQGDSQADVDATQNNAPNIIGANQNNKPQSDFDDDTVSKESYDKLSSSSYRPWNEVINNRQNNTQNTQSDVQNNQSDVQAVNNSEPSSTSQKSKDISSIVNKNNNEGSIVNQGGNDIQVNQDVQPVKPKISRVMETNTSSNNEISKVNNYNNNSSINDNSNNNLNSVQSNSNNVKSVVTNNERIESISNNRNISNLFK